MSHKFPSIIFFLSTKAKLFRGENEFFGELRHVDGMKQMEISSEIARIENPPKLCFKYWR